MGKRNANEPREVDHDEADGHAGRKGPPMTQTPLESDQTRVGDGGRAALALEPFPADNG